MRRIKYDISDGRAISVAASAGHADVLKYLLYLCSNGAMEGRKISSYDVMANAASLLNFAATNGHEKVVYIILEYCNKEETVYINERDNRTGRTAFFSAVMSGYENIVFKLLARGAKLEAHGNTALHVAAEYGHRRILQMLLEFASGDYNSDSDTEFHDIENEDVMDSTWSQKLLRYIDTEGDTPLHKAVWNGHSAVVELILKHRPDIELRTGDGGIIFSNSKPDRSGKKYTPLHLAAKQGHLDIVQLLVGNGADIKAKTHGRGRMALHIAVDEGHEAVVEWLLQNGAYLYSDLQDKLELVIERGYGGILRAFVNAGFRGWILYANKFTDLILKAVEYGHGDLIPDLLEFYGISGKEHFKEVLQAAEGGNTQKLSDLLRCLDRPRFYSM